MASRVKAAEREHRVALGERLYRVRCDKDLTQRAAAARVGIAPPMWTRYERGLATPSAFTLDRMARALDVSPGWLLSGPKDARKNGKAGQER